MDFQYSETTRALQLRLQDFIDRLVLPHHRQWHDLAERGVHPTQLIDDLKALAREEGLLLTDDHWQLTPILRQS